MSLLRQTVTVPENHVLRLEIAVPEDFPPGDAEFTLESASAQPRGLAKDIFKFAGILKDSPNFNGDVEALVRQWRDEE